MARHRWPRPRPGSGRGAAPPGVLNAAWTRCHRRDRAARRPRASLPRRQTLRAYDPVMMDDPSCGHGAIPRVRSQAVDLEVTTSDGVTQVVDLLKHPAHNGASIAGHDLPAQHQHHIGATGRRGGPGNSADRPVPGLSRARARERPYPPVDPTIGRWVTPAASRAPPVRV